MRTAVDEGPELWRRGVEHRELVKGNAQVEVRAGREGIDAGGHPRRIAGHIASLKEKGFITVNIYNLNERVIRTIGRYARVPKHEVRRLQDDRERLIHSMKIGGRGGMTKTSWGV